MLQTDRETDDILWHHRVVKLGRQNVADIIKMSQILSVSLIFKNGHGPSLHVGYTSTTLTCMDRLTNQDRNTHTETERGHLITVYAVK